MNNHKKDEIKTYSMGFSDPRFDETKFAEMASSRFKTIHTSKIMEYDAALRDLIGRSDRTELFRKLREDRPFRFEYGYLSLDEPLIKDHPFLKVLGISNH